VEWVALGVGIVSLGVSGYLLARWKATTGFLEAGFKRVDALSNDLDLKAWERRYKALAADVEDVIDREARMHGRLRKRAKVDEREGLDMPREDLPNGQAFRSGAEVLRYARRAQGGGV